MGCEARDRAGPRADRDRLLDATATVLDECGLGPRRGEDGCLVLGNCPFSPLSGQYNDLICRANLALMQGMVSGLRAKSVKQCLSGNRTGVASPSAGCRKAAGTQ
jgi:predicted ArsR family transcriptional regulator